MDFQDLLALNGGFWRQIVVFDVDRKRTRSYVWGLLHVCHFWRKWIKKCDRESIYTQTNRQADRQTDRQTHA